MAQIPQHYDPAVPVDSLHEHPDNPRRGDVAAIGASMDAHGFYGAVVAQRSTGRIIAGNHRYRVAVARGDTTIPVLWLDATDDQARRILLVDNRTSDLGGYDDAVLAEILAALADTELGLIGTGYTPDDLAELLDDPDEGDEPEDGNPSLAERFLVPPFSVLNARSGEWQERKRRWLGLGIRSEVGRDGGMVLESLAGRVPDYYDQKTRAEQLVGRKLSPSEFEAHYLRVPDGSTLRASGTSVFDPVVCELAYRWFSPPAGRVLDPFAGGSVRGIVAAALGRQYTGVELRGDQVAANREQATEIVPRLAVTTGPVDFTPDLTPVERRGEVWVKRDDSWSRGGANGAKSRVMFALGEGRAGIITAGARTSPQIERAALTAAALGIPCRVHVPAGADTAETETCLAAGAEVVRHRAGRLSVLRARFRDDAAAHPDWLAVPFGMGMDAYVDDVAAQVENIPDGVARVVVPTESGSTLAGVLRGLAARGRDIPVVGVTLGHDPAEYLDRFAPGWRARVTLVAAGLPFDSAAPVTEVDGLALDSQYEAKCLPFLEPGDLLWCVGIRSSEAPAGRPDPAPMPVWHTGDSALLDSFLPADDRFDLVFSCPPYADLEVYSDDPADISNMPYDRFVAVYRSIIRQAVARLSDNRFAVWVVGEARDKKRGAYRGLVPDTVRAFVDAGADFHAEAILVTPVGSLPALVARQFGATRRLGKTHQNVLVFVKGDPAKATEACGPVDVTLDLGDAIDDATHAEPEAA